MAALEREYNFYKANKQELLKKYENKFIVVHGDKVVGCFDQHREAVDTFQKKYALGTFLVRRVQRHDKIGKVSRAIGPAQDDE